MALHCVMCCRWPLHVQWSKRVTEEFWRLGDKEKAMGVPVGPLCAAAPPNRTFEARSPLDPP
jgi:hypothetical protein